MEAGGMCIGYSDAHYGHPRNLIQPGRAETMADGWETARKVNIILLYVNHCFTSIPHNLKF